MGRSGVGVEAFSISRTAETSSPRHPRASLDSASGFKVCNTTMTASGVAMRCISATTMFAPTISRTNAGSSRKVSPAKISRRSASRATRVVVRAEEEPARAKGPSTNQMLVFVPPHPLINHWLGIARNAMTPPAIFRSTLGELGRLLVYECVRDWLPTFTAEVEGPMATAQVEMVDPGQPVAVVPVLRAGLVLLEECKTVLPASVTYHLGFVRDEETLEAKMYLNKLPKQFAEGQRVLISDPMLATGGTIVQAIEECLSRGALVKNIRIVCVVACPTALSVLSDKYPGLRVYAAMIDEELNDQGYIIPGLGDAGDRAFGTE